MRRRPERALVRSAPCRSPGMRRTIDPCPPPLDKGRCASACRRVLGRWARTATEEPTDERTMALRTVVVVGASLAGLRATETLRRDGFDGRIVLVGAEPHLPYDRPPLSKQLLAGEWEPQELALRRAPYDELDVELRLGVRATALDAARAGPDLRRRRDARVRRRAARHGRDAPHAAGHPRPRRDLRAADRRRRARPPGPARRRTACGGRRCRVHRFGGRGNLSWPRPRRSPCSKHFPRRWCAGSARCSAWCAASCTATTASTSGSGSASPRSRATVASNGCGSTTAPPSRPTSSWSASGSCR